MILGRGRVRTEKAIFDEYIKFLDLYNDRRSPEILIGLKLAPCRMRERIKKPFERWLDRDILALFPAREKQANYFYNAFLAFLFFRGYRRASLDFLFDHQIQLCRHHRYALRPIREKIRQTEIELGYADIKVGSCLQLLITLLAFAHKPLEQITRGDFELFREEYQRRYQIFERRKSGMKDAEVSHLDKILVHWGVIAPRKRIFMHEEHFANLRHPKLKNAIIAFVRWMEIKYAPSTIDNRRAALLDFFLWFQNKYPRRGRLDQITRPIALAYAGHLKQKNEKGVNSVSYSVDQYRCMRQFVDFAMRERLKNAPDRNPFFQPDMPKKTNSLPRFISDHELQRILAFCAKEATLQERTIIITLLHTGIRGCELSALKVSDIVKVQGKWRLHVLDGKGRIDRYVPLTPLCLKTLQSWQKQGWKPNSEYLFSRYGQKWSPNVVGYKVREVGLKLKIPNLTAHRFRHTFATALLNHGMRESALQRVMGHYAITTTMQYARILDAAVDESFEAALDRMRRTPLRSVPNFFTLP